MYVSYSAEYQFTPILVDLRNHENWTQYNGQRVRVHGCCLTSGSEHEECENIGERNHAAHNIVLVHYHQTMHLKHGQCL